MVWNKYEYMSEIGFNFIESNYVSENFKKLPIIPIIITHGNNQQETVSALLDSGSDISFINVYHAKVVQGQIIDTIRTSGVTSSIEDKPVIEIRLSNKSMDGNWINLKVAVIDTHHPNYNLILGRDFMELFKTITFDFDNQITTLNY